MSWGILNVLGSPGGLKVITTVLESGRGRQKRRVREREVVRKEAQRDAMLL